MTYLGVEFVVVPPRNRAAAPTAALSAVADVDVLATMKQSDILAIMRDDLEKCGWTFPASTENNANGISRLVGDHQ